jgi:hypothetical protein
MTRICDAGFASFIGKHLGAFGSIRSVVWRRARREPLLQSEYWHQVIVVPLRFGKICNAYSDVIDESSFVQPSPLPAVLLRWSVHLGLMPPTYEPRCNHQPRVPLMVVVLVARHGLRAISRLHGARANRRARDLRLAKTGHHLHAPRTEKTSAETGPTPTRARAARFSANVPCLRQRLL